MRPFTNRAPSVGTARYTFTTPLLLCVKNFMFIYVDSKTLEKKKWKLIGRVCNYFLRTQYDFSFSFLSLLILQFKTVEHVIK